MIRIRFQAPEEKFCEMRMLAIQSFFVCEAGIFGDSFGRFGYNAARVGL
jgi:hypothetical protein